MKDVWTIGVDEAGRGPLAGPVAVAVVQAPKDFDFHAAFPGLDDSKKLSEEKREQIFALLQERVVSGELSYVVRMPSAGRIDSEGIAKVIRRAVAQCLKGLALVEDECKVWLDGALYAPKRYAQETVIGGDGLIPAIMLASVAAKVTRDRYMVKLCARYPKYNFSKHKGYGTKEHYARLKEHGPCAIHRRTFLHLDRVVVEE